MRLNSLFLSVYDSCVKIHLYGLLISMHVNARIYYYDAVMPVLSITTKNKPARALVLTLLFCGEIEYSFRNKSFPFLAGVNLWNESPPPVREPVGSPAFAYL
jgi:hypothetical protein